MDLNLRGGTGKELAAQNAETQEQRDHRDQDQQRNKEPRFRSLSYQRFVLMDPVGFYRADETVASLWYRFDQMGNAGRIAQRSAQLGNSKIDRVVKVANILAGPNELAKVLPRN